MCSSFINHAGTLLIILAELPQLVKILCLQLFSQNDRLEELILSGNQLTRLDSYIFPALTSLKVGLD